MALNKRKGRKEVAIWMNFGSSPVPHVRICLEAIICSGIVLLSYPEL